MKCNRNRTRLHRQFNLNLSQAHEPNVWNCGSFLTDQNYCRNQTSFIGWVKLTCLTTV